MSRIASIAFMVCLALIGIALCYLCFAFVLWDIAWPPLYEEARFVFVVLATMFGIFGALTAFTILEGDK